MSHSHPNNVPLHSYKMCYVSSQQHSSLLQARHQREMPEVWLSSAPWTPKRDWEGCSAWGDAASEGAFNHEKSSGWVYEVKWVNNWVSKMEGEPDPACIVHPRGSNAQKTQEFQMSSPITHLNARFSQVLAMCGKQKVILPLKLPHLIYTSPSNITFDVYRMQSASLKQQGENCLYKARILEPSNTWNISPWGCFPDLAGICGEEITCCCCISAKQRGV